MKLPDIFTTKNDDKRFADKVDALYSQLKSEKGQRQKLMLDVAKLVTPMRSLISEPGQNEEIHIGDEVYDGVPIDASKKMTNGLFGHTCGPYTNWFYREGENAERRTNRLLDKYIRTTDLQAYTILREHGFYKAIYEFISDGVNLGNAAMLTRYMAGQIIYTAISPFHFFFELDEKGDVDVFLYRFPLTGLKAMTFFGEDNLPEEVKRQINNEDYNSITWYLYVIYKDDIAKIFDKGGPKTMKDKPYKSVVKPLESSEIINRSGFDMNPVTLWRFYTMSGQKWGHGPGDEAYWDIHYVNQLSQSTLEGAQLRNAPPLNAPMEKKAEGLRYAPKAANYYVSPERKVEFMQPGGDYYTAIDLISRRDEIINYHFMVDFWTLLSRSTKRETAFEVSEKQQEKLALIAYPMQELIGGLKGILTRTFDLGMKNGLITRPTQDLADENVEFVFNGILAQAQKRAVEGSGIMRALQEVLGYVQNLPTAAQTADMVIDWDAFIRSRFKVNNVETGLLKSRFEVMKEKQQAAAQAAAQQQQGTILEAAKATKDASFSELVGEQGE